MNYPFEFSDRHVSVRERPGVPESGRQLDVSVPARGRRMPRQSTRGYYIDLQPVERIFKENNPQGGNAGFLF
jgi:hypothetical protein